ncbi:hypothetical protein JHK85_009971 [Glycine max]|nr:hypothetical protein JHK85_009971 [Glycine max]
MFDSEFVIDPYNYNSLLQARDLFESALNAVSLHVAEGPLGICKGSLKVFECTESNPGRYN